ncbi:hypothetical protein CEXT_488461, partial [Caerostris extrusa]
MTCQKQRVNSATTKSTSNGTASVRDCRLEWQAIMTDNGHSWLIFSTSGSITEFCLCATLLKQLLKKNLVAIVFPVVP